MENSPTPHSADAINIEQNQLMEERARQLASAEADLVNRQERVAQNLGKVLLSRQNSEASLHSAAEVVGARRITDPLKPEDLREQPTAPESLVSKSILGRFMGKIATKTSVHREDYVAPEPESGTPRPKSSKEIKSELKNARRLEKQQIRQKRSQNAEAIFGGGIGLGQETKTRTAISRSKSKRELKKQLAEGTIGTDQYLQQEKLIKKSTVVVPTREVRRNVRRERLGATYTLAAASKPVERAIGAAKQSRLESKQEKLNHRIEATQLERARIEAELERQSREEE